MFAIEEANKLWIHSQQGNPPLFISLLVLRFGTEPLILRCTRSWQLVQRVIRFA